MSATPIARIHTIAYTPTTRIVTVTCPDCGNLHSHGWPYGDANVGHRYAPCSATNPGYEISVHRR